MTPYDQFRQKLQAMKWHMANASGFNAREWWQHPSDRKRAWSDSHYPIAGIRRDATDLWLLDYFYLDVNRRLTITDPAEIEVAITTFLLEFQRNDV